MECLGQFTAQFRRVLELGTTQPFGFAHQFLAQAARERIGKRLKTAFLGVAEGTAQSQDCPAQKRREEKAADSKQTEKFRGGEFHAGGGPGCAIRVPIVERAGPRGNRAFAFREGRRGKAPDGPWKTHCAMGRQEDLISG